MDTNVIKKRLAYPNPVPRDGFIESACKSWGFVHVIIAAFEVNQAQSDTALHDLIRHDMHGRQEMLDWEFDWQVI